MKRFFFILLILSAIQSYGALAQTGNIVGATGHIYAEVIPVYSATETSQLNFGRFSPGPEGGEILLNTEGEISVIGSIYTGTGTYNAASFYVSGDSNSSFTVSLPDEPVYLRHISSAKWIEVKDWISNPNTGNSAGILQNGEQTVYVGATLKVGTLQDNPAGIYAGTYSITFDFN